MIGENFKFALEVFTLCYDCIGSQTLSVSLFDKRDLVVGDPSRCSDSFLVYLVTMNEIGGWIRKFGGRVP